MTGNDQDVFRKVGRGGAGNFYSVKDDKAAAAAAAADRVRPTKSLQQRGRSRMTEGEGGRALKKNKSCLSYKLA